MIQREETYMKKALSNTSYLKGGKQMNLNKKFIAVLGTMVFVLALFQGCTSSTSTTSSGSGSISRIQVIPAASSMQASSDGTWSSTFITVIVRDNNGNLAPAGTSVTIACGAGFLGDPSDRQASLTVTTDSNGQVQVKYTAGFTPGTASISATSLGNYGSTTITITAAA